MLPAIRLSPSERRELTRITRRLGGPANSVQRARIILSLADGATLAEISREQECSVNTVKLWHRRFLKDRVSGLQGRHKGKVVEKGTARLEARILDWTLHRKPQDGSPQWSSRKLATALGVSHMRVARTWAKAGVSLSR